MDNVTGFIEELVDLTKKGRLQWQMGSADDSFRIILASGVVRIDKLTHSVQNLFEPDRVNYRLTILDSDGAMIEEFAASSNDVSFDRLKSLWEAARRSGNRVEEKMKSILREIHAQQA